MTQESGAGLISPARNTASRDHSGDTITARTHRSLPTAPDACGRLHERGDADGRTVWTGETLVHQCEGHHIFQSRPEALPARTDPSTTQTTASFSLKGEQQ